MVATLKSNLNLKTIIILQLSDILFLFFQKSRKHFFLRYLQKRYLSSGLVGLCFLWQRVTAIWKCSTGCVACEHWYKHYLLPCSTSPHSTVYVPLLIYDICPFTTFIIGPIMLFTLRNRPQWKLVRRAFYPLNWFPLDIIFPLMFYVESPKGMLWRINGHPNINNHLSNSQLNTITFALIIILAAEWAHMSKTTLGIFLSDVCSVIVLKTIISVWI